MPPFIEDLDPPPDPVRCCEQLEGLPYRLFLDSAVAGAPLGRYSFVTADPVAAVRSKRSRTEYLDLHSGRARSASICEHSGSRCPQVLFPRTALVRRSFSEGGRFARRRRRVPTRRSRRTSHR